LELEIEHQAIVQKFLNMEGDLSAVDRTVVGEANFNRNVEKGVIVRVDVESEGDGEVGVGIEEDVGLAEMLHQGGAITGERGELLRRDDMDDGLAVVSFRADIGDDGVWGGEQAGQGKSGEPAGVVEEIVVGNGVPDGVRTGPRTDRRGAGGVAEFAADAGGENKIDAGASSSESFDCAGAGFVVGTSDAAGGAGEGYIRDGPAAGKSTKGTLKKG